MNLLSKFQIKGLEEIGNIGGCRAATAISYLCEEKIIPVLPEIKTIKSAQLKELWSNSGDQMICTILHLTGEAIGKFLIIFSQEIGLYLVNKVIKDRFADSQKLIAQDMLELRKMAEIIANTYTDALSRFLNITLISYLPEIISGDFEMCSKVFQPKLRNAADNEDVLVIQSTFNRAPFLKLWGSFFFVFDQATLKAMLGGIKEIERRIDQK